MAMTRLEKKATDERRRLDALSTGAEAALWPSLRRMAGNAGPIRRQHHIGPYLCDFVFEQLALVIEIDGAQHLLPAKAARDARRDLWLGDKGFHVLRVSNAAVRWDRAAVLDTIRAVVEERRRRSDDA